MEESLKTELESVVDEVNDKVKDVTPEPADAEDAPELFDEDEEALEVTEEPADADEDFEVAEEPADAEDAPALSDEDEETLEVTEEPFGADDEDFEVTEEPADAEDAPELSDEDEEALEVTEEPAEADAEVDGEVAKKAKKSPVLAIVLGVIAFLAVACAALFFIFTSVKALNVNPSAVGFNVGETTYPAVYFETAVNAPDSLAGFVDKLLNFRYRKLVWTSSNPSVATVDENGKLTAVKLGSSTVTVSTKGGVSASLPVNVIEPITGLWVSTYMVSVSSQESTSCLYSYLLQVEKNILTVSDFSGENALSLNWSYYPAETGLDADTFVCTQNGIPVLMMIHDADNACLLLLTGEYYIIFFQVS